MTRRPPPAAPLSRPSLPALGRPCRHCRPARRVQGHDPGRFWEAETAGDLVGEVLQRWFEPNDHIEALEDLQVGTVADRSSLRYRLRVRNDDGVHLVEQQGYYDLGEDGRIERLHVMCAGFRLLPPCAG